MEPPPLVTLLDGLDTWSRAGAASFVKRCPACASFFVCRSSYEKDFMIPGSTELHVRRLRSPGQVLDALTSHRPGAGRGAAYAQEIASAREAAAGRATSRKSRKPATGRPARDDRAP